MKLLSFTPMGRRVIESCSEIVPSFFTDKHHGDRSEELVVITPHALQNDGNLGKPNMYIWRDIHLAWEKIQSCRQGTKIEGWRVIWKYGQEIIPGLRVFQLRNSDTPYYFCLLPEQDLYKAFNRLIGLFFPLSAWQHITSGRGLFHSAGIVHKTSAYLFLGRSGAGKSTISTLSEDGGHTIIQDDHVLVYSTQSGRYVVTDYSMSSPGVPLRSIFFLNQATADQLFPVSSTVSTVKLLKSFLDTWGSPLLFGRVLRNAFAISSAIARSVPAYELHFRKSPHFWDVIDAELGN